MMVDDSVEGHYYRYSTDGAGARLLEEGARDTRVCFPAKHS